MNKVLVGPAPLKGIEPVYAPTLTAAGFELAFPLRHAQMTEAELLAQLPGCVAALAGSEPYTRKVLEAGAAAGLLAVCRAGVGYDGVDVAAATELGIAVGYAPGTNQEAVAEQAILLMLALVKNLIVQHTLTVNGQWPRRSNFPLRGKTLGLVGLGRTGKAVASRAKAFGMPIIAAEPVPDVAFVAAHNITLVPHDQLFATADIVSLHCPLTPDTKHIINPQTLKMMKPTSYLINTSRGGTVDEPALVEALAKGRIAGAGLDVFEEEPLPGDHAFCKLPNVVLTAHTAGVDKQSLNDMARVGAEAIAALFKGEWPAERVVNPQVRAAFERRK